MFQFGCTGGPESIRRGSSNVFRLKEAVDTPYIAHQAYVYITMDSMGGGGINVAGAHCTSLSVSFLSAGNLSRVFPGSNLNLLC